MTRTFLDPLERKPVKRLAELPHPHLMSTVTGDPWCHHGMDTWKAQATLGQQAQPFPCSTERNQAREVGERSKVS